MMQEVLHPARETKIQKTFCHTIYNRKKRKRKRKIHSLNFCRAPYLWHVNGYFVWEEFSEELCGFGDFFSSFMKLSKTILRNFHAHIKLQLSFITTMLLIILPKIILIIKRVTTSIKCLV